MTSQVWLVMLQLWLARRLQGRVVEEPHPGDYTPNTKVWGPSPDVEAALLSSSTPRSSPTSPPSPSVGWSVSPAPTCPCLPDWVASLQAFLNQLAKCLEGNESLACWVSPIELLLRLPWYVQVAYWLAKYTLVCSIAMLGSWLSRLTWRQLKSLSWCQLVWTWCGCPRISAQFVHASTYCCCRVLVNSGRAVFSGLSLVILWNAQEAQRWWPTGWPTFRLRWNAVLEPEEPQLDSASSAASPRLPSTRPVSTRVSPRRLTNTSLRSKRLGRSSQPGSLEVVSNASPQARPINLDISDTSSNLTSDARLESGLSESDQVKFAFSLGLQPNKVKKV